MRSAVTKMCVRLKMYVLSMRQTVLLWEKTANVTALVILQGFAVNLKAKVKYTNPARGNLDFCKQKFKRPLPCNQ